MMNMLKRLWKEEEGQGMTEYGLIIALVAVALIVTIVALKDQLVDIFKGITESDELDKALNPTT
ncbi:MAG: Flp family type IVb pilin [Dehalobacterium sp.]